MLTELLATVGGAVLAVLLVVVGHWFPWATWTQLCRYGYGCGSIWAGYALARCLVGDWRSPVLLLAICCAGGLAVVLAYRVDEIGRRVRQAQMAEQVDDGLQS